jgi:hypothetical protein
LKYQIGAVPFFYYRPVASVNMSARDRDGELVTIYCQPVGEKLVNVGGQNLRDKQI